MHAVDSEEFRPGVNALNAGYFVSRGVGCHPVRIIDSYEIIFVSRGELRMFEEDRSFTVAAGQSLLLHPGRRHGGCGDYPANLAFFWIHFTVRNADSGSYVDALPQQKIMGNAERMTSWFRRYLDDQERGALNNMQAELLILLMLNEFGLTELPEPVGGGMAEKALEMIKLDFEQPITTAVIAARLTCNADYLGRIFKDAYGRTITEQITVERLRYARKMLLESTKNINEVAHACGFNDPAYFRRCFWRESGMTPLKFRRLYGKVHLNTE